jgi:predicted acylesterase/phospholipase RssA
LYDYETFHDQDLQFKSWEVARATSAAPLYFKSFEKRFTEYYDGGLLHNNPASVARFEMSKVWTNLGTTSPDVLLSVGSGHQERCGMTMKEPTSLIDMILGQVGGLKTLQNLKEILLNNLDSEKAWHNETSRYPDDSDRYFRMSPGHKGKLPELDDLEALYNGSLKSLAANWLANHRVQVENVAQRLLATSLYFECDKEIEDDVHSRTFSGG